MEETKIIVTPNKKVSILEILFWGGTIANHLLALYCFIMIAHQGMFIGAEPNKFILGAELSFCIFFTFIIAYFFAKWYIGVIKKK